MSFDVRSLAAQKHAEGAHAELDWLKAFESARQSLRFLDLDDEALEHLALASRSPAAFTRLMRLLYAHGRSHPHGGQTMEKLLALTSESRYALSDWIDAIDCFAAWLTANQRKADLLAMLKYLKCCADSPDARAGGQTFAALVADMLHVAGYDG